VITDERKDNNVDMTKMVLLVAVLVFAKKVLMKKLSAI